MTQNFTVLGREQVRDAGLFGLQTVCQFEQHFRPEQGGSRPHRGIKCVSGGSNGRGGLHLTAGGKMSDDGTRGRVKARGNGSIAGGGVLACDEMVDRV